MIFQKLISAARVFRNSTRITPAIISQTIQKNRYSTSSLFRVFMGGKTRKQRNIYQKIFRKFFFLGVAAATMAAYVKIFHALGLTNPRSKRSKEWMRKSVHTIEGYWRMIKIYVPSCMIVGDIIFWDKMFELKKKASSKQYTDEDKQKFMKPVHERNAKRILRLCLRNGGIYAKWGQELYACKGMIPDEYPEALKILLDNVPAVDFSKIDHEFIEDFGKSVDELYLEFDRQPIAAASLAQVHKAKLHNGQQVAVKVQYPDVRYYFEGDVIVIKHLVDLLNWYYKVEYDYTPLLNNLRQEYDSKREVETQKRAAKQFEGRTDIYVPKIYDELTSDRIITMEFIDGVRIDDVEGIKKLGLSVKEVATLAFTAFAEQIFIHGFLHSDPHPANVFVRRVPNSKVVKPQVVLLDHALYQEVSDEFRIKYCKFWRAVVLKDKEYIKEYCDSYGIKHYDLYASLILLDLFDNISFDEESMRKQDNDKKFSNMLFNYHEYEQAWVDIYKNMPLEMDLIIRNSFLLRSVNNSLGVPVNRFVINSRVAARALEDGKQKWRLVSWLQNIKVEVLMYFRVLFAWMISVYLNVVSWLYGK